MDQRRMMQQQNIIQFKLILIGDGGVGKTTYLKRIKSSEFERKYISTAKIEIFQLLFQTNKGAIQFNVFDTVGQEKFQGVRDGFYIGGQCAIIMFDVTSRLTYKNVPRWYKDILRVCDEIPIVIVGNKVDIQERKVKGKQIKFHQRQSIEYYDISVKSNYQVLRPFISLARRLLGDYTISLIEEPIQKPQEILIDEEQMKKLQQEQFEAENNVLCLDKEEI